MLASEVQKKLGNLCGTEGIVFKMLEEETVITNKEWF